jgi:predicted dehydrogenase
MVADSKQVKELFAEAKSKGCFLMEAEKTMFTPLNRKLKQMIEEGVIGKLQAIRAEFSYDVLEDVERNIGCLGMIWADAHMTSEYIH